MMDNVNWKEKYTKKDQIEYSDPYDGHNLNNIFGYGGFYHLKEEGLDVKHSVNNNHFIRCLRLFKIKNL